MNTVTLSLEDYNELKAKADCYDAQQKAARTIFGLFENKTEKTANKAI